MDRSTARRHANRTLDTGPALCAAIAALSACAGAPGWAAELEEVVVTAARREQSTLEVPYNISAISAQKLLSNGIGDVSGLMRTVPGLASYDRGPSGNGSNTRVIIRGLNVDGSGTSELRQVTVSPVSIYIDDTPVYVNLRLTDIDRVEVLRGPQGTLYGSGALGGTVRFLHRKPDTESLAVEASAQSGITRNADSPNYEAEGILNLPISSSLAVRAVAGYSAAAGFVDLTEFARGPDGLGLSDGAGGVQTREVDGSNDSDTVYTRIAARFAPNESLTVDAAYQRQEDDADGRQAQGLTLDQLELYSPIREPVERTLDMYTLEVNLDLGFAALTSSSSWVDNRGKATSNFTPFTFPNYEAYGYVMDPVQYSAARFRNSDDLYAQEVRLVSTGEGPIEWVAGVYYLSHETREDETETLYGLTTFFPDDGFLTDQIVDFGRYADIEDTAVFGELTWHATDRLSLTGGARWFESEVDAEQHYIDPSTLSDYSGTPTSSSDQDVILKLNASLDLGDSMMAYATWSQGYRRGGANSLPTTEPPDIQSFEPDTVDNYEVGLKGTLSDWIQFSGALYYIDWQDVQIATFSPVSFLDAAINGGAAVSRGMELEVTARPTERTVVSIGYAYTDATLDEDFSVANGNFVADDGAQLPGAPEHMVAGSIEHTVPADGFDITLHLDASHTSYTVNEVTRRPLIGKYREFDGFLTVGSRVTIDFERWSMGLFGENLTDSEGVTAQSALIWIPDQAFEWLQQPRTFGAFVRYRM